jgi:mRNA interferase MazF
METLKPGDVVLLRLKGAVERKIRPCVVLSSEEYQQEHPDVIVGLVTARVASAVSGSDYVLQDWAAAGLRHPSAFRAYLATEWQADVEQRLGRLSERDWSAVQERVRRALAVE